MLSVTQNVQILLRYSRRIRTPKNIIFRSIGVSHVHTPDDIHSSTPPTKSIDEIPGPSSLPLIGPVHNFLPGGKFYNMNRQDMCDKLHKLYGPIVKIDKVGNQPTSVFLFDPESISKIFRGEETSPRRFPLKSLEMYRQKYNKQDQIGVLINGVGSQWKEYRSLANKAMLNPKIVSASYTNALNDIGADFVARFQSMRNKNNMIPNFDEEMKLWALECAGLVALGRRLNCFRDDLPEYSYEKRLITLIDNALRYIEILDFEHKSFDFNGRRKKLMHMFEELESVITYFMNKTIENLESNNDNSKVQSCTVEKMINQNKDATMAVVIDSLIAGVDTVAHTAMFLMYFLGTNPEKLEKLRAELTENGENSRRSYLKACIKESNRLFPTSLANVRVTTKPYQVLGYEIPKDILVVVPNRILNMMESQFPRAHEFIPERWLVEKEHPLYYGNAHPFAFIPFGYGIRACLGRRVAELTIETFIINMLKKFDIKWTGPPAKSTPSTVNKMQRPIGFVLNDLQ